MKSDNIIVLHYADTKNPVVVDIDKICAMYKSNINDEDIATTIYIDSWLITVDETLETILKKIKSIENKRHNEGKTKETKIKVLKTNRDFTVAALQGEYDIGEVTEKAVIYNNINCPYVQGDQRAECEKLGKNIDWETCTECKKKWLDREPEW